MSKTLKLVQKRRTIYHLGKELPLSKEKISELIEAVTKETPSAFNSQSSRVVVLFDDAHERLWNIAEEALRKVVPEGNFGETKARLDSFRAGRGTILFFEDEAVIKELQAQFALYADNFPKWSEQAHGITLYAVWLALAEENIGASIQHYSELIEAAVKKEWALPETWQLKGQMPFGSIESPADEKGYIETESRFKVFK